MTKQEIFAEAMKLDLHDRVRLIANIVKSSYEPDCVIGELLREGEEQIGLVFATGVNAEPVIEAISEISRQFALDSPDETNFSSFDKRKKE